MARETENPPKLEASKKSVVVFRCKLHGCTNGIRVEAPAAGAAPRVPMYCDDCLATLRGMR